MFCPIEQIELTVSVCPARKCSYKKPNGQCGYSELTEDQVDIRTLAEAKNEKPYKVKAMVGKAVKDIKMGLAIDRYAEYVKSSFPREAEPSSKDAGTVNTMDSHVSKVLREVFGLASNQQLKFWSKSRFTKWASTTGSAITLDGIRESLAEIKL